jgi:adenylate cyclase, class 2
MKCGGGIEFEAKFLDISVDDLRKRLKSAGAKLVHARKRYVRSIFHRCTNEIRGFARVRDEGGKITMTVKTYADPKFPEETEINIESSYDEATKFMLALGLPQKAFQETYREKWSLDDPEVHEITFDDVPGIPTYMEVDCTSESKLNELIAEFGLDKSKMRFGAFDATYEEYYGIAKKDINDNTPSLTFANIEKEIRPTKNHDLLKKVAAEQRSMGVGSVASGVSSASSGVSSGVNTVNTVNTVSAGGKKAPSRSRQQRKSRASKRGGGSKSKSRKSTKGSGRTGRRSRK